MTARLAERMKDAAPETRAEILYRLGRRADATAQATVLPALKDPDKAVRLAAIDAAGHFTSAETVTALLASLESDQADEVKAAQGALARMSGEKVTEAAAASLPKAPRRRRWPSWNS